MISEIFFYFQLPASGYSPGSYSRPEYGSSSYLDTNQKSDYESYNPISFTGSKVDLNTYTPACMAQVRV